MTETNSLWMEILRIPEYDTTISQAFKHAAIHAGWISILPSRRKHFVKTMINNLVKIEVPTPMFKISFERTTINEHHIQD
jgi:hypothetical protein